MKYFGGCDSGSTYTKCVIIDENGKMVSDVTLRSRINAVLSAEDALNQAVAKVPELKTAEDLAYLVGTGYGAGVHEEQKKKGDFPYDLYANDLLEAYNEINRKTAGNL